MKKNIRLFRLFIAAAILAVMLTLFGGCFSAHTPDPSETLSPVSLADVLNEKISSEGIYNDDVGNIYNYSYHMPILLIDSPTAENINDRIEDFMQTAIEQELAGMENSVSLTVPQCGYAAYLNGNVLSLVLFIHTDFEYSEYTCFNIDVTTGKELSNEDLLRIKGWDSEHFLSAQKTALQNAFFLQYPDIEQDITDNEVYTATVSDNNLSLFCPMYFGPDQEVRFIGKIYSFGGADYYYYTLSAENSNEPVVIEAQTVLN